METLIVSISDFNVRSIHKSFSGPNVTPCDCHVPSTSASAQCECELCCPVQGESVLNISLAACEAACLGQGAATRAANRFAIDSRFMIYDHIFATELTEKASSSPEYRLELSKNLFPS